MPLVKLYRKAREINGVKRVFIASGLRYDLAVEDPEYMRELITHHVGGYLKIAPEHTEDHVLAMMRKPKFELFTTFKNKFEEICAKNGLKQEIIPYFIQSPRCLY